MGKHIDSYYSEIHSNYQNGSTIKIVQREEWDLEYGSTYSAPFIEIERQERIMRHVLPDDDLNLLISELCKVRDMRKKARGDTP